LKDACEVTSLNPDDEKLLFINGWNEWGEGAHLESDARYGFAYLNATANVLRNYYQDPIVDSFIARNNAAFVRKSDVGIALHCYHEDLAHEIVDRYISAHSDSTDVVATVRPDVSLRCLQHLSQHLDNVLFLREQNRGRDVRPFLLALREMRKLGYKFACKVHTKRSPQVQDGNKWRNSLIGSLLDGGDAITLAEQRFSERQDLGLLVPAGCLVNLGLAEVNAGNRVWLDKLLPRMGRTDLIGSYRASFPAGSMYWFRVAALAGLDDLLLEEDEFELEAGQLDGTLAHAVERIVVLYASMNGYDVEQFNSSALLVGSPSKIRR
jgi:lipopolysaccharide biosynthesis protein